ncbi:hypothetical protein Tco_1549366 [Tanacetum coccineum]
MNTIHSPCFMVFIPAMSAYSFTIHHLASRLPSILHASCMVSCKGDLYKLLLVQVMAAPTIPVSVEENLGDPILIRVNVVHPAPVAIVVFPTATVVRTLAQHREVIRGIQEQFLEMPTQSIVKDEREACERIERQLGLVQEELESL